MCKLNVLIKECIYNECIYKGIIRVENYNRYDYKQMKYKTDELMYHIRNSNSATLDQVRKIVINNIWTDTCMEIVNQRKQYFVKYFASRQRKIKEILITDMYDIFVEINSSEEQDYIDFKKLDIEVLPDSENLITSNWKNRNLYMCIKHLLHNVAKEIVIGAKEAYKIYLLDIEEINIENNNLLEQFSKLQTKIGRMEFIQKKIWSKVYLIKDFDQETFETSSLLFIRRDIISLLRYSLSIRDLVVSLDILDIIIFIIGNMEYRNKMKNEVILLNENAINEIKEFLYDVKIKQIHDILISL